MFTRLVGFGYFTIDEEGQRYIATHWGAFMMTYRLLPPFKQIQSIRKNRLAEKTSRELGFGGLEALQRISNTLCAVRAR